jgi:hypothetical protein
VPIFCLVLIESNAMSCCLRACSVKGQEDEVYDHHNRQEIRSRSPKSAESAVGCKNIRLSADVANPLSRSRNRRADGDGCVGWHLIQVQ